MDPGVIGALIPVVAIAAFAAIKIARIVAERPAAQVPDAAARIAALEQGMQSLQEELAQTQERLDFAERMLTKGRGNG